MSCIDSIEITGFWGRKNVSLKLNEDLNFLIGPNGSGKTTVINLIAAALQADFLALYSIPFERISIQLNSDEPNKNPIIDIVKATDRDNIELKYTVCETRGGKEIFTYSVEGRSYDERMYRGPGRLRMMRRRMEESAHLIKTLSDLVKVSWLSIHRVSPEVEMKARHEETYESTVDQKLRETSRGISSYFSLLASQAEKESNIFQEYIFLSLFDKPPSDWDFIKQLSSKHEDKLTLWRVLRELGISDAKAKERVDGYFDRLEKVEKAWSENKTLGINEVLPALSDARRVGNMVEKWRELQEKRRDIFEPSSKFEDIINELFSGKKLRFNERNLPEIDLESGEQVDMNDLSSGEKQMFILLGETLLQEGNPFVFISDEPELSLHVKWQSSLFKHIRSLNSACQVVTATHSPDIVGGFQDRVIKIEEHISDV